MYALADEGCELLGGGCTRQFAKSDGEKPWCVPIVLDEKGVYAPDVHVGTTKCRVECDQDYGILNASGKLKCTCLSSTPSPCDQKKDANEMPGCFCRSPSPCNSTDCPCITKQVCSNPRQCDWAFGLACVVSL